MYKFKVIILFLLMLFSFYLSDKITKLAINKNPIMQDIQEKNEDDSGKRVFWTWSPHCERSTGKNRMVNLRDARAGFASIQEIVMIVLVALWELVEWYTSASR